MTDMDKQWLKENAGKMVATLPPHRSHLQDEAASRRSNSFTPPLFNLRSAGHGPAPAAWLIETKALRAHRFASRCFFGAFWWCFPGAFLVLFWFFPGAFWCFPGGYGGKGWRLQVSCS